MASWWGQMATRRKQKGEPLTDGEVAHDDKGSHAQQTARKGLQQSTQVRGQFHDQRADMAAAGEQMVKPVAQLAHAILRECGSRK